MSKIYGNMVGGASLAQTYILQDSEGNEITATLVDSETVFDATPNDIRSGKVAATETGVTVGTKEIPSYNTSEGYKLVTDGSDFILTLKNYDYTKLQAIICPFDTSLSNSVAAEKVAIEGFVYEVQSTTSEAEITKDDDMTQIHFGISNNTGNLYLIRYFTYKEIY